MATMKSKIILLFLAILILISCKKTTHESVHQNHIITGNLLPYYNGVSTIKIQSYINKVYVDLLGREANSIELHNATMILINSNLSDGSRDTMVANLINTKDFYVQLFLKTSGNMLNSTGKQDVLDQINFYNYLYQFNLQNHDTVSANGLLVENDKLIKLSTADSLLKINAIDINEFYRRFIFNYFYDEINMGAENYVKASFENLYYRLPTTAELTQSEAMINGLTNGTLFLQSGSSKGDFAYIATHCNAFYEGLITTAYANYLLRKPTDIELNTNLTTLSASKNYTALIKSILKSKEYAGF
ncbi:MAG: hypothetical protein RJA07_2542 [Bacteroidota bacterium]|jgi:hypothetical protein